MARNAPAEVMEAIITTLTPAQIQSCLRDADLWVTEQLEPLGELSAALLKGIEKYLACHFITLNDPRLHTIKSAETEEKYQRDAEVTEYLKAAMALDTTGTIMDAFTGPKRRPRWRVGAGY